jgi:hypothetical protein
MKLLIMQFRPASRYIIPLRSKYYPQHPVLKFLSLCSSQNVRGQKWHPYKTETKTGDETATYI